MNGLLRLVCGACGGRLAGDNNSRVFFCRACSLGFWPAAGRLERASVAWVQVPELEGQTLFPFWRFAGPVRVVRRDGGESEPGQRIFFVPAFFIKSIGRFGDIGFFYTQRGLAPACGAAPDLPIFPADRDPAAARDYPRLYVQLEQSRLGRAGQVTVDTGPLEASLLMVPFQRRGEEFVDPLIGWKYPVGALV